MIPCAICHKQFKKITNTHLWNSHQLTIEEYREQFPDSPIDEPGLADRRVEHLKGKSYVEVYGQIEADKLKTTRKTNATEQMKDTNQLDIRKEKCGYEHTEDQNRNNALKHTTTGAGFRDRALDWYGLECARCGFTSETPGDFDVHHRDMLNIVQQLSDHRVENLEVLCRKCHSKLHNHIQNFNSEFTGMPDIEKGVQYIFRGLKNELGLDLSDVNFKDTPKRVARAYREIFSGVKDKEQQLQDVLATGFPSEDYNQMIICKDIIVYSMCPHHLLPVEYKVHIGYIPSITGMVLGLSKLARIAEICAKQPVLQETMTNQIGKALNFVNPDGVMVIVNGVHFCMRMRGIQQCQTSVTTSYINGVFEEPEVRAEFLSLIK